MKTFQTACANYFLCDPPPALGELPNVGSFKPLARIISSVTRARRGQKNAEETVSNRLRELFPL